MKLFPIKWWSEVLDRLSRCGVGLATSQALFITSGKKHTVSHLIYKMLSILSRNIHASKWNRATHSHTFLGICWMCCTARFHSFTPLSTLLPLPLYVSCPHPHPCMFTDFLVCASVSRELNTGLFDESVQKQPADLPWHAHTLMHWANVMLYELKQCFSKGSVFTVQDKSVHIL